MNTETKQPKTDKSGICEFAEAAPNNSIKTLEVISYRLVRSMSKNKDTQNSEKKTSVSSPKPAFLHDPRREMILLTKEKPKDVRVPFFITVMGENGNLLLNVYQKHDGKREVKLFFNRGKYDDGLQIVRSCLRNMLSFDFKQIIALNVFRGFYLAVQTSHNNESTQGYQTDTKYKNNIGLLEYVSMDNLYEFAKDCNAVINPKLEQYFREVRDYIQICKDINQACQ
jgi:alpha-L-fucosidase